MPNKLVTAALFPNTTEVEVVVPKFSGLPDASILNVAMFRFAVAVETNWDGPVGPVAPVGPVTP